MKALDDKLTPQDLDEIIEEVDEDGSGTLDFEGKTLISIITNRHNTYFTNNSIRNCVIHLLDMEDFKINIKGKV